MADYGLSYGTQEEFMFRLNLYAQKDEWINNQNAIETTF